MKFVDILNWKRCEKWRIDKAKPNIVEKTWRNVWNSEPKATICWNSDIWAVRQCAKLVDLQQCWKMSIFSPSPGVWPQRQFSSSPVLALLGEPCMWRIWPVVFVLIVGEPCEVCSVRERDPARDRDPATLTKLSWPHDFKSLPFWRSEFCSAVSESWNWHTAASIVLSLWSLPVIWSLIGSLRY